MSETQRVAIVTGAAGGIGRGITRGLLGGGRPGHGGFDRDRDPLETLAAAARQQGKATELLTIRPILLSIPQPTRSSALPAPGSARSISWSTTPVSGRARSVRTAGRGRSSSGKSLQISGAALSLSIPASLPLALTNAVVPEMMRRGWGRIVNVTTSLGTMLNAGSPTYGPSKAALEAMSAIMAKDLDGTGVTVNVLVPGGVTNTPMISDIAGFDRAQLIRPEVMAPPLLLARLRRRREGHRPAVSRHPLGPGDVARTSRREGRRAGRLDQHSDDADHAGPPLNDRGGAGQPTWSAIRERWWAVSPNKCSMTMHRRK